VGQFKKELDDLNEEWSEYKKPINEEIFQQKQDITDMKVEYQYKTDKIKETKKDIKETVQELTHKREMKEYLTG